MCMTSCDGKRGSTGIRVGPLPILGHEALAHQATQIDLPGAEEGELEVEEGDDLAVPQGVHQREVPVVDELLDEGGGYLERALE